MSKGIIDKSIKIRGKRIHYPTIGEKKPSFIMAEGKRLDYITLRGKRWYFYGKYPYRPLTQLKEALAEMKDKYKTKQFERKDGIHIYRRLK